MVAQAVRLTNVDIDNALKNKDFDVIFQPIYQLSDGMLLRLESFVRWVHPGLGTLPPGAFISFFENQGRMSELTRYVIETSLDQYLEWRGNEGPGFSVNLAFSDLQDQTFPAYLAKLLKKHKFPAHLLTLECPSPPTSDEMTASEKTYAALNKIGINLAIEVRGRANDAMRNLNPFPFAEVKTGGSAILRFARTVRGGPGLTAVSELLEMAKENDARTIAVGVEDQASLSALTSLGFSGAQGNFLGGVGEIASFDVNSINTVRQSLSLGPIDNDAISNSLNDHTVSDMETNGIAPDNTEQDSNAETAEASTIKENDAEADRAARVAAAKQALTEKRRTALILAKKKTLKKEAEAKIMAQKAEDELAERIKLQEKANADMEKNARKLQDRLNKAFDLPGVEDGDPTPEAGLLLGGSLAETALNQPPEDVLTLTEEQEVTPSAHQESEQEGVAGQTELTTEENIVGDETNMNASSALTRDTPDTDEIEPSEANQPHNSLENELEMQMEEDADIEETQASEIDEPQIAPPTLEAPIEGAPLGEELDNLTMLQRLSMIRASVPMTYGSSKPLIERKPQRPNGPVFAGNTFNPHAPTGFGQSTINTDEIPVTELDESDLRSEEELLDAAFEEVPQLEIEYTDEAGTAEEYGNEEYHYDTEAEDGQSEAAVAARFAEPRVNVPKRKNFLTRRYKIYSGYFWPKSWRQGWARRQAQKAYNMEMYHD